MESIASQGTSFRSMSWTGGSTTGPTFQSILLCNDSGTASCHVSTTPCPLGMPCLHQLYSLYNPDTLSLFSLAQDKLGVASPLVLLLSMIWGLQILQQCSQYIQSNIQLFPHTGSQWRCVSTPTTSSTSTSLHSALTSLHWSLTSTSSNVS